MAFQLDILSAEQLTKCSVGWHPVFEFERLLNASTNSRLLHCQPPSSTRKAMRRWKRGALRSAWRTFPPLLVNTHEKSTKQHILFISALNPASLEMLDCLADWRNRYDIVVAYVVDSYPTKWYSGLKRYLKLDHIFVPILNTVASTQKSTGVKTHYLPFGTDTVRYGNSQTDRPIDVVGYGRQPEQLLHKLEEFNSPETGMTFLRSTPKDGGFRAIRDAHFRLLSLSKIAIAFSTDDCYSRDGLNSSVSIVTPRWAECLASGCLVAGTASEEAREIFDWEDAIIELPQTTHGQISAIKDLLEDAPRLAACHARNALMMKEKHDWRHRISQIFETIGVQLDTSTTCLDAASSPMAAATP